MKQDDKSIAIIGAGISGMACAHKLRELGYNNIKIFEKDSKPGGRMITEFDHDIPMDTGAQFFLSNYAIIKNLHELYNLEIERIQNLTFNVVGAREYTYNANSNLKLVASILKNFNISDYFFLFKIYLEGNGNINQSRNFNKLSIAAKDFLNAVFNALTVQHLAQISLSMLSNIKHLSSKRKLHKLYFSKKGIGSLIMAMRADFDIQYSLEVYKLEELNDKVIIHAGSNVMTFDKLVMATEGSHVKDLLEGQNYPKFLNKVKYSKCITVHINTHENILNNMYARTYTYSQNPSPVVISKSTVSNLYYIVFNESFYSKALTSENLEIFITEYIKNNICTDFLIRNIKVWSNALPIFSQEYWNELMAHKTENKYKLHRNSNIYLAGDYMNGPATESAAESGFEIAKMIRGSKN